MDVLGTDPTLFAVDEKDEDDDSHESDEDIDLEDDRVVLVIVLVAWEDLWQAVSKEHGCVLCSVWRLSGD